MHHWEGRKKGFGCTAPKKFYDSMPFTVAINANNAFYSTTMAPDER